MYRDWLTIRKWKYLLPDGAPWLGGFAKKKLLSRNPTCIALFRQEVNLARRITHPNVCRTYDFERDVIVDQPQGTKRDLYFLTMEFLPGETLSARIRRIGALSREEALAIARQIAHAVDSAHSLGIIHRDLKPGNLMITSRDSGESNNEPRAVVTDFGLTHHFLTMIWLKHDSTRTPMSPYHLGLIRAFAAVETGCEVSIGCPFDRARRLWF